MRVALNVNYQFPKWLVQICQKNSNLPSDWSTYPSLTIQLLSLLCTFLFVRMTVIRLSISFTLVTCPYSSLECLSTLVNIFYFGSSAVLKSFSSGNKILGKMFLDSSLVIYNMSTRHCCIGVNYRHLMWTRMCGWYRKKKWGAEFKFCPCLLHSLVPLWNTSIHFFLMHQLRVK